MYHATFHQALSPELVREADRVAIEQLGLPGVVLMENAGRNAAEAALRHLAQPAANLNVAVVCGGGNNGGDGYVLARHLHNHGARVTIWATRPVEALSGDAAVHARVCQRMGVPMHPLAEEAEAGEAARSWAGVDLLVDALLGTGFSGELRPPLSAIIGHINEAEARCVLALDTPSGLDCGTGKPASPTVRADLTATFLAPKTGFEAAEAEPFLGRVVPIDIGVPPELVERLISESRGEKFL